LFFGGMMDNFLYVDLALEQGDEPKPFDGMAAGAFTDMWGREFEILPEDMQTYAVNTAFAIESTRDSKGDVVGLPISSMNHENREAAGWITGVELSADGQKLIFTPRWNALGREMISGDYARFFSPTVDIKVKAAIGGSLTNWPATRTANHQILLKPIELSSGMFTHEPQPTAQLTSMFEDLKSWISGLIKPASKPEPEQEPEPELALGVPTMTEETIIELTAEQQAQMDALIEQRVQTRFEQMVAREKRKNDILDYTRTVTGKGLPVQGDDLTAFLSSLTAEQLEKAQALFSQIADTKPLDFEELGHNKVLSEAQPLPDWAKPMLTAWLSAGNDIPGFFKANAAELGVMTDYNLKEFEKEK